MPKSIFLVSIFTLCIKSATLAQPSRHVILISIDGFRPEMYQDTTWPTPNLQELTKAGTSSKKMKSVFPSYTYPSHSSMVTGAYPATHQVTYNVPFDPVNKSENWNWETSRIKARTIWDAAKEAGLKTAIVQWPVSVDAPVTWLIPEIWPEKDGEDRITEVRKHSTPGLIEEIEMNATGPLTRENMNEEYLSFDANSARMAAYLFKTRKPELLAVHFAGVDGAEHEQGRDGQKVKKAVAAIDRAIGDLLETIERTKMTDSTTIIIVGDHGFSTYHQVIFPNKWLLDAGLFHPGKDWGAMFNPAGGSAFLYLQNPDDKETIEKVKTLLAAVPDEYKKLFRVIEKPELIKMGADRNAVLALAAWPGVVFGGNTKQISRYANGGHHGYDPDQPEMYTGFIAAGSGINKKNVIDELTVTDIAPIIMALLNVPFKAPDGHIPKGLLLE